MVLLDQCSHITLLLGVCFFITSKISWKFYLAIVSALYFGERFAATVWIPLVLLKAEAGCLKKGGRFR